MSFFPHFLPCLPNPEEGRHTHVSDVESEECMKKRMSMWLAENLLQALSYTVSSKGVLSVWQTYGKAAGFIFKILHSVTLTSFV